VGAFFICARKFLKPPAGLNFSKAQAGLLDLSAILSFGKVIIVFKQLLSGRHGIFIKHLYIILAG
jgi:hypothetical protein